MTHLQKRYSSMSPAVGQVIDHGDIDVASGKARAWPYVIAGFAVLTLLIGGFGAWAYTAQLDGAVIADARFVVESKRKTIRHLEGGIVNDILVGEGDHVRAGQVLLTLDATVDKANFAVIDNELMQLSAQRARLLAELNGAKQLHFEGSVPRSAADERLSQIEAGQQALFRARFESRQSEESIRRKRVAKLHEEISGIRKQVKSNDIQISFIEKELVGLRELEKRQLVPRNRVYAMEREAEGLRGQTAALEVSITRAANSIEEIELEAIQAKRRFAEQVTEEMRTIEPRITALTEQRAAAGRKLDLVEVKAPTDGFVVALKANTKGGVIRPGDDIMDIVPQDDRLVLEARVPTTDVDKVRTGSDARIQLTAFDQAVTPEATGKVLSISADRLEDDRTGQGYFLARLELNAEQSNAIPDVELVPGMPATVFIQTGKRTPLSYLLQPLNNRFVRTFAEG